PDEHDAGTGVISDHPETHVISRIGAVAAAGELLGQRDHWAQQVGLVHVGHVLEQQRDPLHTHPGIDVLGRQRLEDREVALAGAGGWSPLVLHEDQVPDLQEAIFIIDRATGSTVIGPAVDVDFRAGTARAGHAHGPEVVVHAAALDVISGNPGNRAPQVLGFVVVGVHGHPDAVWVKPVPAGIDRAGHQLPGVLDG